jgi:hypothetical protein
VNPLKNARLWVNFGLLALAASAFVIPAWAQNDSGDEPGAEDKGTIERAPVPFGPPQLSDEERDKLQKQMEEFRACMQEQGVELPAPPDPGEGQPPLRRFHLKLNEDFRKAAEKCGGPPRPPFLHGGARFCGVIHPAPTPGERQRQGDG